MNGRMAEERKGMLLVVSGPAGAGKGTLIERLMQSDPTFVFSVSCTTREMRYYETNRLIDMGFTNYDFSTFKFPN